MNDTKRQNFNITPEQEAELSHLREVLDAPNIKEAVLRMVRIVSTLKQETEKGGTLYVHGADGSMTRLLIPELEPREQNWKYLVERPHPWRRQLYVKGRKLLASTVWREMQVNELTLPQAMDNWDLPVEAIREIQRYCESNQSLIQMEAQEERHRLLTKGVLLDKKLNN